MCSTQRTRALAALNSRNPRHTLQITFVGKNTPAYESLLQLLRGCAQQQSFTHIQGPADALMAKVLWMLRSVETLCIDVSAQARVRFSNRCSWLHAGEAAPQVVCP